MSDEYIRSVVRDEINKLLTIAYDSVPKSALREMSGLPEDEFNSFLDIWHALFGIEGEAA